MYDNLPEKYAKKTVSLTSNKTGGRTKRPLRDVLRERYAEITAMDRAIGRLRDWLTQRGLNQKTLVWYCGDNGTPTGGIVTSPFRGVKGTMYQGGIRVPGLIEWPGQIPAGQRTDCPTVTSDILPTICDLLDIAPPNRPMDGVSLKSQLRGKTEERSRPICFWNYGNSAYDRNQQPYIEPALQQGTTPLVKMMAGRFTRNFTNFRHPQINAEDYRGVRVILDGNFKLILRDGKPDELFHLGQDPAEERNLASEETDRVATLKSRLKQWQTSVLQSLTGADYRIR